MENKYLIDLSIRYGLNDKQISKIVSMAYQAGITDLEAKKFSEIAEHICKENLVDAPAEVVIEELKLKGFIAG